MPLNLFSEAFEVIEIITISSIILSPFLFKTFYVLSISDASFFKARLLTVELVKICENVEKIQGRPEHDKTRGRVRDNFLHNAVF